MANRLHRLLVIEDNDADVFLIKKALRGNDIPAEVIVCADGEAAVRLLSSPEMAPPDAIVLDLALPRMEGLDVLQKILYRPTFVGIPIMVFTSSPSPSDKHRVKLLAAARYVQKPSGVDNFLREVAENIKSMLAESGKNKGASKTG
jgi:CheY-like chemotaxis protein